MGADTKIAWTDHTFNPWWGCARVSPGCENCYAESFAAGRMNLPIWGARAERKFFGDKHWSEPLRWDRHAQVRGRKDLVFCSSMADVFEDRRDLDAPRARLFRLVEGTTSLIWLLLTKRPENAQRMAADLGWSDVWPSNVWLGTTAENQAYADRRIPTLLATRGPLVRFVSYEPALGPVDFRPWICAERPPLSPVLDWIIVGGESGPGARPFCKRWAMDVIDQVRSFGGQDTKVFVKQMGQDPQDDLGRPVKLRARKGDDPSEWDEAIRVQEWPVYAGYRGGR